MSAARQIALCSALILCLELAFIRVVPAEVRAIAYFTNLVLMAAFYGLGLGLILQRARFSLAPAFGIGLLVVAAFIGYARGIVTYPGATGVHFWLEHGPELPTARSMPLAVAAFLAFGATSLPFLALGQRLGRLMQALPNLPAYAADITGSLIGTVGFAVAAALSVPPWIWPIAACIVWIVLETHRASRALACAGGIAFVVLGWGERTHTWSPYYLIESRPAWLGLSVFVNSSFHQAAVDFTRRDAEPTATLFQQFSVPYDLYRSLHGTGVRDVLVLGAGTGNDVAVALANGAQHVVAVEIDPVILRLGRALNPSQPYADARVTSVVDDARHFLQRDDEAFDLVVFGTLDSQTLVAGTANLRLDNYVYTTESFAAARRHLRDGGICSVAYSSEKTWLRERLYETIRGAFGDDIQVVTLDQHYLFNTFLFAAKGVPGFAQGPPTAVPADVLPAVDDWPYLFLERPTVAPVYQAVLACVLGAAALAFGVLGRMEPVATARAPAFFLLGAGFSLLESAAVVRFALLFGSTWITSAVVFVGVLATIFVANAMLIANKAPSERIAWYGVLLGLVLVYVAPMAPLLGLPGPARALAAALLIGAPIYFAAVCFGRMLSGATSVGYALGINLVGAMTGGVLEYAAMVTGLRGVWFLALLVYLAALVSSRIGRS